MKLSPSLRQKKRYVVFEVIDPQTNPSLKVKFKKDDIKLEVEKSMQQFWGDLGNSKASPMFIEEKFNLEKQRFILKVNHKYVDELKMALALSKKIKNIPIIMRSIITSGTIKKASSYM